MALPTLADRDTAGARYAAAVAEFRASRADLAALDRAMDLPGFGGNVIPVVDLRHSTYVEAHGSLADDTRAAFEARTAP